ncbi:SDR family oxidoreductase [Hydrogenivirga sp. 128-5-R1-1]|uniref:NAD-dependent epimerase/dehydratase family protein n=1 Tax=Hydrogenivirga sp. 128-5-R1-1 TaxID=392423 RepID=UPI00015EF881|nr:SDR family oxidoreductase [Hydrogenivirga sp. 128-5-R1-1]EDP75573.1 NAD-dependent epimerase/dehydratase family protein, putative [Hydrogenivirga sp. 128-5-R1-1]
METVLVTGAGGYIGSVLIPKLLNKGYKVKAVDRYFFGKDKLKKHENLQIIKEDTRKMPEGIFKDVDYVIDLVAISNDPSGELFNEATWQINYESRVRTANLSKKYEVKRYILPSSCSIYGFQENIVDETSKTNPLTTYAKANEKAEQSVLPLANDNFVVTVIRQATVFGYSPRMRFDLAINGMTYGAWKTGKLPLMRDGTQYRPMVHVQDTTDVMILLLSADINKVNGEIFNVGGNNLNYQIGKLGEIVAKTVEEETGKKVEIEWYGDPDRRSYKVSFDKIRKILGWEPKWDAKMGVKEIVNKLETGELEKTTETITLNWYKELERWYNIIKELEMYGGILNIKWEI